MKGALQYSILYDAAAAAAAVCDGNEVGRQVGLVGFWFKLARLYGKKVSGRFELLIWSKATENGRIISMYSVMLALDLEYRGRRGAQAQDLG